ncbi:MAG: T9SS type A sorting domain-containing protein, partial [Candidatus Zixiibacteriota bacterium]
GSYNASVLLNNGNGTFQAAVNYGAGAEPSSVFAVDLDGDGDNDLAVANAGSDDISILINLSITTGIDNSPETSLPESFSISQNYPNPFNATTAIRYDLPEPSHVIIEIFDLLGRKVQTLVDQRQPAGHHQVTWNAKDKSSGIYFYKLKAGDYTEIRSMLLLK